MSNTEWLCLCVAVGGLGYIVGLHVGHMRRTTPLRLPFFQKYFGLFRSL